MIDARTPVLVVSGFLGSGKTTLVNRLLAQEKDSLVVVNELGAISVDHYLVQTSEERTVALPNGCLCCRLRGDLEETLVGAAMRRRRGEIAGFDRVIVETSGIADPGPVAQTLFADESLARDFRLGRVVTVVDAADAGGRAAAPSIARAQIAAADLIVLSKADRASARELALAQEEINLSNPIAGCVTASFGDVDAALLTTEARAVTDTFRPAQHAAGIQSFVLRIECPVPRDLLQQFLSTLVQLSGERLLRVKGAVPLAGGGLVLVQGVRHVFDRFRPLPAGSRAEPALVFITAGVDEAPVQALWQAMVSLRGGLK